MVDEDIQKHLIDEVLEYLVWLQEPNEAFEGMPVCPFVKKDFFGNQFRPFKLINKKPILPTLKEMNVNNRSRSAKLRAAEINLESKNV